MPTNAINPHPDTVVILRGVSIPFASDIGGAFIADCSRNRVRLMSNNQICESTEGGSRQHRHQE